MRRRVLTAAVLLNLVLLTVTLACAGGSGEKGEGSEAPSTAEAQAGEVVGSPDATGGVLLFGIGMHIEPLGATVSSLVTGESATAPTPPAAKRQDYSQGSLFARHTEDIRTVAGIVETHGGRMTVQAQTPFTMLAIERGDPILSDLHEAGHEIALHFHEDAHLGRDSKNLSPQTWCAVMKEEIGLIAKASGSSEIRYFSGGNLYPGLIEAADCAGLDVNSDWKNPQTQTTDAALIGTNPWRPAGGSNGSDVSAFATHDPNGPLVFLPEGQYGREDFGSMRRAESAGGDQAYFDFLKKSLMDSIKVAQADPSRVHVFHFTVHPGEFRGTDPQHPYQVIERFLAEVVDPLVASGQVQWATFSQMADAYTVWEESDPGADPSP